MRRPGATPLRAAGGQIVQQPRVGDIVLVHLDASGTVRPLLITRAEVIEIQERATPTTPPAVGRREFRVSGTIFAEPDDHTTPVFRGWAAGGTDPARISGRPDRLLPLGYGEYLAYGVGLGQWTPRSMGGR